MSWPAWPSWATRFRSLRIRYAILGAVLAALWAGRSAEPAWEHALRTILVLLTIRPLLRVTLRYRLRRARSGMSTSAYLKRLITIRLAMVAAALGASWLIGYLLDPAHRHGELRAMLLRLLLLALTIPFQVYLERSNRGSRGRPAARLHWRRFITAKVGLVLAALGAEVLLERWLGGGADVPVAAGLFLTVALLGPWAHRRYFTSSTRGLRATQGGSRNPLVINQRPSPGRPETSYVQAGTVRDVSAPPTSSAGLDE